MSDVQHLMSDKIRAILRAQDLSPLTLQTLGSAPVRLQNVTELERQAAPRVREAIHFSPLDELLLA